MSNDDDVDHSGGKDDEQKGSRGDGSAAADRSSATNQQQLSSGSGDNRIALLSRQMQQQQQQQQHQYTPLQYSTRPDFSSAVRDASASFLNPSPYHHHHHQHFSPFGSGGGGGYGAGASSLATVGSDERNAAASMGLLRGGNSGGSGMTPTAAGGESEQMMMMQQHQQQFHQYNMSQQQPSGMKKSSGRESGEDPSSVLQYGSSMPHQYQIKSVLKEFPFVYDGHSGWVCRHCSHLPHTYRGLNYAWQGGEEGGTTQQPPPNSFVDQHLRFCPALNQPWAFSRESMSAAQGGGGQIPMQQPRGDIEGTEGEGGTVAAPEGEKEKRPSRKRKPDPPTGRSPMANMTPAEAAAMFPVYSPHPYQMSMSTYGTPQMMKQRQRRKSSKSASPKGRQTTDANYEKALVLLRKRADEMPRPSSSDDDIGATLVQEEDNDLLTDYFYYMMYQLVVCRFTEKDRKTRGGKRQDVVVGYGGLQCAHCASTASSRKFFWSNVDRLANSFAEIPAHVLKCKMCPEDVLEALLALKGRHAAQMALLPRGSQKVFLRRIWRRLHDKDSAAAAEAADTPAKRGIEVVGSALKSPEVASGTAAEILKRATAASSPEAEHHQQQRVLIALPQDKDWLSDMDCFIRKQVEVFSANSVDVKDAKEDGKFAIQYGQVGLRCVHCAKVTKRARGDAVTYPHAISCIYESVRELQRLHFSDDNYCPNLPQELKSAQNRITTFASSLSSVLRRYYVQAAKALGLFDTEGGGIRAGGTVIPLLAAGFSGSVVAGKRRSSLVKEEDDNEEEEGGGEQQRPAKRVKQSDDDDDDDIPKSPRPPAA